MKEIFRHRELHQVTRSMDILENVGIETLLRNENLSVTYAPIPEFFPNLCVLNDEEFPKAVKLLGDHDEKMSKGAEVQLRCPSCGEMNPGNLDVCFSCHEPINQSMPC
ncbi:MAG: DUF2007 domain-containing protein [Akkermansiaceae bacterium]|nr:DUF2007 domain-containing protein [Akkermansiaceae bacterium]